MNTITDEINSQYSDLFGIGKGKAARQEARKARQEKRGARQVEKARIKGAKERAQMGLDELPAAAATAPPAKSKSVIYAAIGAGVLIIAAVIFFIKRK